MNGVDREAIEVCLLIANVVPTGRESKVIANFNAKKGMLRYSCFWPEPRAQLSNNFATGWLRDKSKRIVLTATMPGGS